jgi:hypothetical protein
MTDATTQSFASLADLARELHAITAAMVEIEPEESRIMRLGKMDNRAGSYGQYFGTWDIANGMIRDYSMYMQYPLLRIAEGGELDVPQFATVFGSLDTYYSDYLRFSGYPRMGFLASELRRFFADHPSRQDVVVAMRAYVGYTNRLAAWAFHYFPWGLGKYFQYADPETPSSIVPDLSRRVGVREGTRIRLTWQPLGLSVEALLATSQNPELCADLIEKLPFTIVQDHAVVTGKSMYAWTPVVSTAPVRVRERICDAPIGRLRYSQSTGQKFIVQYGPTIEDLAQPILGEIVSGLEVLPEVGKAVWESTFNSKELIWLTVELA